MSEPTADAGATLPPQPRIKFFVEGIPQPGGSKKGVPNMKWVGRSVTLTTKMMMQMIFIVEDAKGNKKWRTAVRKACIAKAGGMELLTGPLVCSFGFLMPRPKGHYGTGKNAGILKASAPAEHIVRPDVTKLTRSTEDALTKVIWSDDSQVISQHPKKRYCRGNETPGAWITIWQYDDATKQEEMPL